MNRSHLATGGAGSLLAAGFAAAWLCAVSCAGAAATINELISAIIKGDVQAIQAQVDQGFPPTARDSNGRNLLHHAIEQLRYELIAPLAKMGVDPNIADRRGITPLIMVCEDGNLSAFESLIEAGAVIRPNHPLAGNAFRHALIAGHPQLVQRFLDAGFSARDPFESYENRSSPLLFAARGTAAVVDLLVSRGARVEEFGGGDFFNLNPLISAAAWNRPAAVNALIRHGARVSTLAPDGDGALPRAARARAESTFEQMLAMGAPAPLRAGNSWAQSVWEFGRQDFIDKLKGAHPGVFDRDPVEALLQAVYKSDIGEMERLFGIYQYNFDERARQVLFPAAVLGDLRVLNRLHLEAGDGGFLDREDSNGLSQVHHAVMGGKAQTLEFFLRNKAPMNSPDSFGRTPLMLAAMLGNQTAIQSLLAAGAVVNTADFDGRTAHDYATMQGHAEVARLLELSGAVASGVPSMVERAEEAALPQFPAGEHAGLPPVTVAMLPFDATADGHYASTLAGGDLAALLQAGLASLDDIQWVERAELSKAMAELEFGASGLAASNRGLAVGHLLGADLVVTGSISADWGLGRTLRILVVDARSASLLAERRHTWKSALHLPLQLDQTLLKSVEIACQSAITEARVRKQSAAGKRRLAPLFVSNITAQTGRLDMKAEALPKAFQKAAAGRPVEVLNFQAAQTAFQEVEMACSGLAQVDPGIGDTLAHHYVWGSCEELSAPNLPFAQTPVMLRFEVWHGQERPQPFEVKTTVAEMEQAAERLAVEILDYIQAMPEPVLDEASRTKIAQRLLGEAKAVDEKLDAAGLGMLPRPKPQWWMNQWAYGVKLLDTARFFAPEDAEIATIWLLHRWNGHAVHTFSANSTQNFANLSLCHSDWNEYFARHGMRGFEVIEITSRIRSIAPQSFGSQGEDFALRCHRRVQDAMFSRLFDKGLPYFDALPPEIKRQWRHMLARETAQTLLTRAQDYSHLPPFTSLAMDVDGWSKCLPLDTKLKLAPVLWKEALRSPRKQEDVEVSLLRKFRAIFVGWFEEAGRWTEANALFDLSAVRRHVPSSGAPAKVVASRQNPQPAVLTGAPAEPPLPVKIETFAVPEYAARTGKFYFAHTFGEKHFLHFSHSVPDDEQGRSVVAMWSPETHRIEPIAPSPFIGHQQHEFFEVNELGGWFGGHNSGVYRLNADCSKAVPESTQTGMPMPGAYKAASLGETTFFITGKQDEQTLMAWHATKGWGLPPLPAEWQAEKRRWIYGLAAHGDHVYCLSNISKQPKTLNRFHVPSQTWSLEPLPKEIAESGTYSLTTDARGLWAVQKTQTILLPYESTQPVIMQNPCIIHTRTMVVHDGDWLWVHCGQFTPSTAPAASRGVFSSHLFLIDKRAPAILGRVDLGDDRQPVGLVVTPQWVCPVIDTQPHKTSPLLKLDKAQVLKAARALP